MTPDLDVVDSSDATRGDPPCVLPLKAVSRSEALLADMAVGVLAATESSSSRPK
jgi:hypothetical protein